MKKLLVIILLFFTLSLNAQISTYLDKGLSGVGITAGYEGSKGYDAVFGKLSYSLKGNLELTASVFQSYFNENEDDLISDNANDLYYSAELDWWMIREKLASDIDVNLALIAGFQGDNYKNYEYVTGYYDTNGLNFWTGTYNGYIGGYVGLNFNLSFNLPGKWSVQPMIMTYFGVGNDSYTEKGETFAELYHGISSYFGASVSKKMVNGSSIVLTVLDGISNYNDYSNFDIGISYVFALK